MRIPSLHITRDSLEDILEKISGGKDISVNSIQLAGEICRLAKPYSITRRSVITTNDRIEKKVKQINSSNRIDAELFANLLYILRKKSKHRGIVKYVSGCKDWETIKEITDLGDSFCKDFGFENKKEGYTEYIKHILSKMNQFNIHKFKSLHQQASEDYGAMLEMEQMDNTPNETESILQYYNKIILDKTGMDPFDYSKVPDKYIFFFKVKEICKTKGIDYKTYIDAQFEGLAFANGIPQPSQLVGPKAEERLVKYMYENNVKVKRQPTKKVDWERIKNAK